MRITLHILLIAFAFIPLSAYAEVLQTTSISSSQTGGISARSGATVTGTSSASAEIHTVVEGGVGSGSSYVEITTEADGVRQTETRHYDIPRGSSVRINAATSRGSTSGARGEVSVIVPALPGEGDPSDTLDVSGTFPTWVDTGFFSRLFDQLFSLETLLETYSPTSSPESATEPFSLPNVLKQIFNLSFWFL